MDGYFFCFDGFEGDGDFVDIDFGFSAGFAFKRGDFLSLSGDTDIVVTAMDPEFDHGDVDGTDEFDGNPGRFVVFPCDSPFGEFFLPIQFFSLNEFAGEGLLAVEEVVAFVGHVIGRIFIYHRELDF